MLLVIFHILNVVTFFDKFWPEWRITCYGAIAEVDCPNHVDDLYQVDYRFPHNLSWQKLELA